MAVSGATVAITGAINGQSIEGEARSDVDAKGLHISVDLSDVPGLNHPCILASGSSAVSFSNVSFAVGTYTPAPVPATLRRPLRAEISYMYLDESGNSLGRLIQKSSIVDTPDDRAIGETHLSGEFTGPGDYVWTPGYKILLQHRPDGSIQGVYGQTFHCASGAVFFALVNRVYRFDTPPTTWPDQVLIYRTRTLNIDKPIAGRSLLHAEVGSYWVPAEFTEFEQHLDSLR